MSVIDGLTAEQAARLLDFAWFRQHLKIEDRDSGVLRALEPNEFQGRIRRAIVEAERDERPCRLIVLKSRRMGSSTIIQATFAHRAFTRRRFMGTTMAHKSDASSYLFGMAQTMWDELPGPLKLPAERVKAGYWLRFANQSELRVETAGDKAAGRSKASRALHASEVAHWPGEPFKTLPGVKEIVPTEPGTVIVEESTANGVGDIFHANWLAAIEGRSSYTPIFGAWYDFAPNRLRIPEHYDWGSIDEHEIELTALGVSPEQLHWRRRMISDQYGGDVLLFNQEHPWHWSVAFLTSGRPFFTGLERVLPVEPRWRGAIDGTPARGRRLRFLPDPSGILQLWAAPDDDHNYVVFADVAGLATDKEASARRASTDNTGEDYSAAFVLDLTTGEQVAEMHGRMDADEYARELARLGYLYRGAGKAAWLAVENTGGYGNAVLLELDRHLLYPRLYRRRELDTHSRSEGARLGWATTQASRPLMLDALKRIVREAPANLKSAGLLAELQSFVIHRNGKPAAEYGTFDDRVMAAAGAYAVYAELATTPLRIAKRDKPPVPQASVQQFAVRL